MGYHMGMMSRGMETHALRKVKHEYIDFGEAVFTCCCQAEFHCE
jgi:hypothetical protein